MTLLGLLPASNDTLVCWQAYRLLHRAAYAHARSSRPLLPRPALPARPRGAPRPAIVKHDPYMLTVPHAPAAMTPEDIDQMLKQVLLKDLRIQCRARGLSPAGGKEQLSDRLKEHMIATKDW